MISKKELQEKATQLNLNLGQMEKNYLQTITLYVISKIAPELFVFKGGTSIMMIHNLNRFSEDLDFNIINKTTDINKLIKQIKKELNNFEIDFEIEKQKEYETSKTFAIRFKGPLYDGTRQTTSKVELDISQREKIQTKTEMKRIISNYQEIPTFYIQAMSLEEIFSEKIRAIMTRNKARDLFDTEYLIAKGIKPNIKLINEKLKYYKTTFSKEKLQKAIEDKEKIWLAELRNLIKQVPEFKTVKEAILKEF